MFWVLVNLGISTYFARLVVLVFTCVPVYFALTLLVLCGLPFVFGFGGFNAEECCFLVRLVWMCGGFLGFGFGLGVGFGCMGLVLLLFGRLCFMMFQVRFGLLCLFLGFVWFLV